MNSLKIVEMMTNVPILVSITKKSGFIKNKYISYLNVDN